MKVLLVTLITVCVLHAAWGASYEAALGGGSVSMNADGSEIVASTAIGLSLKPTVTLPLRTGSVAITAAASDFAALSAGAHPSLVAGYTAASCSEVFTLTSRVYVCVDATNAPLGHFFLGSAAGGFRCDALLAAPRETFNCTGHTGGTPSVGVAFSSPDFGVGAAGWTLSAGDASAYEADFVAFVAVKLASGGQLSVASGDITARNSERRDESRTAVIFLFVFVAAAMSVLAALCAVWQGWIYPIFPSHAEFWWFAIFFVLIHLISWIGGLAGWISVLSLVGLYITLMPIVYICIRWQHRRLLKRAGLTHAELVQKYGEQQEEEDVDDTEYDEDERDSGSYTYQTAEEESEDDDDDAVPLAAAASRRGGVEGSSSDDGTGKEHRASGFTQQPSKLGRAQGFWLLGLSVAFFVCGAICAIIFFAWSIDDYYVWDRHGRTTVVEFQPKLVAKTIGIIYSFDRFAAIMRMDWLLQAQTKACGVLFKKTLTSDSEKKTSIQEAFIEKYSIDMSIYDRTSYTEYTSVNDWFTRQLAVGARPIYGSALDNVVVSSADCRAVVYESVPKDLKLWLKGEVFTAEQLVQYNSVAQEFHDGPVAILRLAPADYHRTHAPVTGVIEDQFVVKSTIYSVGADAMRSNNGAVYNTRTVTIINTGTPQRKVAFVAIGATCVGSVVMSSGTGATVVKGQDISFFQFGGSTVVLMFPPGSISFDADLVYNSLAGTETLITMGSSIGTWN